MTEPKNPKSPSTDEMIAELAQEFGLGGKKEEGAEGQEASSPASEPGEAPAKKEPEKPEKPEKGDKKGKGKDKDKDKRPASAAPAAPAAPRRPGKDAPLAVNPDAGMDEALFPVTPGRRKPVDLGGDEVRLANPREEQILRSEKKLLVGLLVTIGVVFAIAVILLSIFLDRRRDELAAHEVVPENWVEMLSQFDVHQQEMVEYKRRKAEEERKAKTPLYGHIKIETDPAQADVYIACLPLDARCNNVGTKDQPRWDDHFVKDEELGDRACTTEAECQECAPAPAPVAPPPGTPAGAVPAPQPICKFAGAQCVQGKCKMPMRTAITIQSLWIGNLLGVDPERKYQVRISKPGWVTETFEVTAADWTNQLIPGRSDSDRVFLKQIPLKVDLCCFPQNLEYCQKNLPEDVCKEMEAHLQKVAAGQANCSNPPPEAVCKELELYLKAKAEYQAAMLQAMEEAQKQ